MPEPRTLRITITRATNLPCRARFGRINLAHTALGLSSGGGGVGGGGGAGDTLNRSQMVPLAATMGGGVSDQRPTLARLPAVDTAAGIADIDDVDLQPFVEVCVALGLSSANAFISEKDGPYDPTCDTYNALCSLQFRCVLA